MALVLASEDGSHFCRVKDYFFPQSDGKTDFEKGPMPVDFQVKTEGAAGFCVKWVP